MGIQFAGGGGSAGSESAAAGDLITQAAHGFASGQVVRWDGDEWVLAQADSVEHAGQGYRLGFVEAPTDDNFRLRTSDRLTLVGHDFPEHSELYLSDDTPGGLTATAPDIALPLASVVDGATIEIDVRTGGGASAGEGEASTRTAVFDPVPTAWVDWHYDWFDVGLPQPADLHGDVDSPRRRGFVVANFKDNASDYLSLGTQLGTPLNYTIIAAIRISDAFANRLLGSQDGAGTAISWGVIRCLPGGVLRTNFGDGANYTVTETDAPAFVEDQWVVVAVRHAEGDEFSQVWVNGVEVAASHSGTGATSVGGAAQDFNLGRQGDLLNDPPNATYGVTGIWTSALTDQQVVDNSNLLVSAYGVSP